MKKKKNLKDPPAARPSLHLVLGGSQGIGFAYAAKMAKNGDALAIVGRRKDPLVQAKDRLTRLGASSVATLAGDLLDPAFREVIKNFRPVCDSVLVGGPSPPLGGRNYCTAHTGVKSPE